MSNLSDNEEKTVKSGLRVVKGDHAQATYDTGASHSMSVIEGGAAPGDSTGREGAEMGAKKRRAPLIIDDDEEVEGNVIGNDDGAIDITDMPVRRKMDGKRDIMAIFGLSVVAVGIMLILIAPAFRSAIVSGIGIVIIMGGVVTLFVRARKAAKRDEVLSQLEIADEVRKYKQDLSATLVGYNVKDYTNDEVNEAGRKYREMLEVENASIAQVDVHEMAGVLLDGNPKRAMRKRQREERREAKRKAREEKKRQK